MNTPELDTEARMMWISVLRISVKDEVRPRAGLGALTVSRERKQAIPTVKMSAEAEAKTENAT